MVWNAQTIAAFPFRSTPGALVIYPIVLILVGALVWTAIRRADAGFRRGILFASAVTLGLPVALTLATMEGRGVIWQGRYLLAFSVGVVLVSAYALCRRGSPELRLRYIALAGVGLMVGIAVPVCSRSDGTPSPRGLKRHGTYPRLRC